MSRDDLLNVNYKIMQQVTEQVVKYSPNCIIIPVSNPLDAMAQAVLKLSKFPRERVIGMAGVLDSARMRAFIAVPPSGITDPSSVLPVQIFLWSDEVDRSFVEKTSAAIIVLLVFMLVMNGLAIYLRNRFERRW